MTDTTATTPAPESAPPPFSFPFEVPADLSTVPTEDLVALQDAIREHSAPFRGVSPAEATDDTVAALHAYAALARTVVAESATRRAQADEFEAAGGDLDAALGEFTAPPEPPGEDDEDDEDTETAAVDDDTDDGQDVLPTPAAAVTAAAPRRTPARTAVARRPAPRVRDVARGGPAPQLPGDTQRGVYGSLTAAADLAGFSTGQTLDRFADAAKILSKRLDQYPTTIPARRSTYAPDRRPITAYSGDGRQLEMRSYTRHPGVELRREFPPELRVRDDAPEGRGYEVAEFAASERRLPGGSLVASMQQQVKAGRSLTAAAGWCAPSETIYELCELETMDGILDAPEMQTTRGGWSVPENGGPDFSTIYNAIGNSGDTHLTEAEVIADVNKVCTDIPCPDFVEVRLGVDYVCLTGSLLQRRGYPEIVARWGKAAMVALAHKTNQGFIAALVAGSGNEIIIPADPSGDDAASALLYAVDLAITDIKYRNRMGFGATVEVVLPWWARVPIRAGLSRRTGVALVNVTDAQIAGWFADRNAVVRFVYDWQDAFSGLDAGPGGSTPLTTFPGTVQFLAFPAGTWVKAVQDVISLDTIYDSTKLATNEYTAIFAETGWAALKLCTTSRLYTARLDMSGVVGCCPGEEVS
jgi:hypothetical protein